MNRWTCTWIATLLLLAPGAGLAQDDGRSGSGGAPGTLAAAASPGGLAIEHGKAGTADASPVDPGAAEFEVGYAPVWNRSGATSGFDAAAEGHQHLGSATITYGVAPDLDVSVAIAFGSIVDMSLRSSNPTAPSAGLGLGDAAVGARWRLLQLPARSLEVAVVAGAVLPVGERQSATSLGLSQEYWSVRGGIVATKDLGRVTTNAELGVAAPFAGDAGGVRTLLRANTAVGVQILPWLQPEVELNYQAAFGAPSQVLAATAGVVAPFGNGQRFVAAVQQDVWGRHATARTAALFAFKTAL